MREKYHEYSEYSHGSLLALLDFVITSMREYLPNTAKALRGLDIGCGSGNITIPLAFLGYQMVGIDISPGEIENAERKKSRRDNPTFLIGDAENLGIAERASFDFVICTEVLEHLHHPEKALNSIDKALKEAGILIASVPNGYGPYSLVSDHLRNKLARKIFPRLERSYHFQSFTSKRIKRLMSEAGFDVLTVRSSNFLSFLPLLAKSRLFCYWDRKLASKLPLYCVSGFYLICKKRHHYANKQSNPNY